MKRYNILITASAISFLITPFAEATTSVANSLLSNSKLITPLMLSQRNCDTEVQFNKDDNKLTSPVQASNLDQTLSTHCTWYNLQPNTTIVEDAGMQVTVWLQNDPTRAIAFAKENKLEHLHLHCVFTPTTQGLGGKLRMHRNADGVDHVTGVMVAKSGAIRHRGQSPVKNGNVDAFIHDDRRALLSYTIHNDYTTEHPFNQIIDADVPNYSTFWDSQTDPTLTTHPSYSQVNVTFILNDETPDTNQANIWFGKKVFNDGDAMACDVTLVDRSEA